MIKIFILGDWQYSSGELQSLDRYVENVNRYEPDYVVVLGDYGSGKQLGKPEGIIDSAKTLSALKCENVYPMLGNHDLQRETGDGIFPKGYIESIFMREFKTDSLNHIIEFEDFRLFIIGLEPQSKDSFGTENECYISSPTVEFISRKIEERPGVPVIMFTHAPPIGCGLRTVPNVHVRACNAFLNQKHNPKSMTELAVRYDEIRMWFCGHYHLGQHYTNSSTYRFNTYFFLTGLVSSASRDGTRQSRIVEVDGGRAMVSTYNHLTGSLENTKEIMLTETKKTEYKAHKYNIYYTGGKVINRFSTGDGNVLPDGLVLGKNGLLYALTDNSRVWEIDIKYGEALGTLVYSDNIYVSKIIALDTGIACFTSKGKRLYRYDNPERFMREKDDRRCSFEIISDVACSVASQQKHVNKHRVCDAFVPLEDGFICYVINGERPEFIVEQYDSEA